MSGVLIAAFVTVHLVFSFVQVVMNQAAGGVDCGDVALIACGNPVLHDMAEAINNFGGTGGGIFSILQFLLQAIGVAVTGFIKLAFFNYPWLGGGGEIVDTFVFFIRMIMGAVFFGVIAKIAITAIGGRLAR